MTIFSWQRAHRPGAPAVGAWTAEAEARKSDELWAQPGEVFEPGQCRRGKVVFDIPTGQSAQYFAVTYSPFSWQRWRLT